MSLRVSEMEALKKVIKSVKVFGEKSFSKQCAVQINSSTYPLNPSRSKYISIGLQAHSGFPLTIILRGNKADWVAFYENEWKVLVDNQGVIANYFYSNDTVAPLVVGRKTIYFQSFDRKKVIKIQDIEGSEVWLGVESVNELWELLPLIEVQLTKLKSLDFYTYYSAVITGICNLPGDFKTNIDGFLQSLKDEDQQSENMVGVFEMVKYYISIIRSDIEIEQFASHIA